MSSDRIEKQIVLKASRERVWQAISDSRQFGTWFGVAFDGPFVAGAWVIGRLAPTQMDPEVAKLQEPYAGMPWRAFIESIEPMRRFAFRWHPFAIDRGTDYEQEPTTLVTFALSEVEGGTLLTIMESGFDQLPPARRDAAFKANEAGWTHQRRLIEKYLAGRAEA